MTATPIEAQWPALRRAARTVVVVDLVESVRLIEQDEEGTVRRWQAFVGEVATTLLPLHGGRLVKSLGDGLMVEFEAVPPAIQCAIAMQQAIARTNAGRPGGEWLCLRIGAHTADVIVDEHDIYGAGVNLAARLTTLAGPGEIVVSAAVRDHLVPGLDAEVDDLGECFLKHVAEPVRAYRVGHCGHEPVVPAQAEHSEAELCSTIAVIPFDSRGDAEVHAALGELLAECVIAQLSLAPEFQVISRLSTSRMAGRAATSAEIGVRLGAQYVVSGSCHASAERLAVVVELADTRSGHVVWAERLSGTIGELLEPHSELVHAIAAGAQHAILRTEALRAETRPIPTLQASTLLIGAVAMMHRQSRADFGRARQLLEHLSDRYPAHATPKAWLAKWYAVSAAQGWSRAEGTDPRQAAQLVGRALDSEPAHALAWTIKGLLHGYVDKDFAQARAAYDAALRSNPSEALAWLYLATLHGWQGDAPEAVAAADKALRLSPLDPMKYYFDSLASAAMLGARRYARAVELARRSLRSNRAHLSTFRVLTMAEVLAGEVAAARATAADLMTQDPQFTVARFMEVSPWAASPDAQLLGEALAEAGVPAA